MAHFQFAVSGQVLDLLTPTKGISDGLNVNSAEFEFRSPEWQRCTEKWAHFYNPDFNKIGPNGEAVPYDYNLVGDEISSDRGLNLPAGLWEVFVHGAVIVNNEVIRRYVTESQTIWILQSGVINAEPLASITPSVAEQVSAMAREAYNARITAAAVSVVDGYGTPEASVTLTGEDGTKLLTFTFENLRGNGVESVVFTESGPDAGRLTITLSDETSVVYDGIRSAMINEDERIAAEITRVENEATRQTNEQARYVAEQQRVTREGQRQSQEGGRVSAEAARVTAEADRDRAENKRINAENGRYNAELARVSAETARATAETARASAETARESEFSGWSDRIDNAEAWAVGERDGQDVPSTDPTYHNNSKYYSGLAEGYASSAYNDKEDALDYAHASEGFAVGKKDGQDVPNSSPYYHNNAAWYSNAAGESSGVSEQKALVSEGYALGQQNGYNVGSGSPYFHNNSKYYSEQASASASSAHDDKESALDYATAAEGFALGKKNGSDVPSTSPYYHNNAKYYNDQALTSSEHSETSALVSEGFSVGEQDGVPVTSESPYYHNNAKYYAGLSNDRIFWCTYDVTTYEEITQALEDGLLPCVINEWQDDVTPPPYTPHTYTSVAIYNYTRQGEYMFFDYGSLDRTDITMLVCSETWGGWHTEKIHRYVNQKTVLDATKVYANNNGTEQQILVRDSAVKDSTDLISSGGVYSELLYSNDSTYDYGTIGEEVQGLDTVLSLNGKASLPFRIVEFGKYIHVNNGEVTDTETEGYGYTDYIDIGKYYQISYKRISSTASTPSSAVAFYDENKNFVCSVRSAGGGSSLAYAQDLYTAPLRATVKYARFTILDPDTYGAFAVYGTTRVAEYLDAFGEEKEVAYITPGKDDTLFGITVTPTSSNTAELYGTNTATGVRYLLFLNGHWAGTNSSSNPVKRYPPGHYKFYYNFTGIETSPDSYYFDYTTSTASSAVRLYNGDLYVDRPFTIFMRMPGSGTIGTELKPATLTISLKRIGSVPMNVLSPAGDTTDMSGEIVRYLDNFGECRLAAGDYYVSGIDMLDNTSLVGCGAQTRIILLDSVTTGYAVKMGAKCSVRDCTILGGLTDLTFTDEDIEDIYIGTRHGILWKGEATGGTDTSSDNTHKEGLISGCFISRFTGGGITCESTGYGIDSGITANDCHITNCGAGINISWWSEYNRFTAINCNGNYYGVINNGGNNMYSNCSFNSNNIGFYTNGVSGKCVLYDGTTGTVRNGGHGSAVGCTINHSGMFEENKNEGYAIYTRDIDSGFTFDGCQIFYGKLYLRSSAYFMITNTNFGSDIYFYIWAATGTYMVNMSYFRGDVQAKVYDENGEPYEDSDFDSNGDVGRAKFINCYTVSASRKTLLSAAQQAGA